MQDRKNPFAGTQLAAPDALRRAYAALRAQLGAEKYDGVLGFSQGAMMVPRAARIAIGYYVDEHFAMWCVAKLLFRIFVTRSPEFA